MNRQAITFLSLFSLILVLSVYYVMIPPLDYSEITPEDLTVTLQDQLEEKRDSLDETQKQILASSSSTGEEINQALESLNQNKKASSIETEVTATLTKAGYQNVFCEISGSIIKVSITKADATSKDAATVMNLVLSVCDEKYSPEIKFITE